MSKIFTSKDLKRVRKLINYKSDTPYGKLSAEDIIDYAKCCFRGYMVGRPLFGYEDQQSPCQYIDTRLFVLYIKTISELEGKEYATKEYHGLKKRDWRFITERNGVEFLCTQTGKNYLELLNRSNQKERETIYRGYGIKRT